jgi:hypothetical protein
MAVDLLYGEAATAQAILAEYQPMMTKDAYLAFQKNLFRRERYDGATNTSENR